MPGYEDGRLQRSAQHLVRVPTDGVGEVAALQVAPVQARHDETPAPAGVHVHPDVAPLADGSNLLE